MLKMAEPWTPEYEMSEWWDKVSAEEWLDIMMKKMANFNPGVVHCNTIENKIVVDVGGGKYGGALRFFKTNNKLFLVDPLVKQFEPIPWITMLPGYCHSIPIEYGTVDVLFCIETLDHCRSLAYFFESIDQIRLVLKLGGIAYFQMPLRDEPIDGHPISAQVINVSKILDAFEWGDVEYFQLVNGTSPKDIYLIVRKK